MDAEARIERAMATLEDLRGSLAARRLAKGAGAAAGEVAMRAVSAGAPLQRAVTAAVERALGVGASPATDDLPALAKAAGVSERFAEVMPELAMITGITDTEKLRTIAEAMLPERVPIDHLEAALPLAKAVTSEPIAAVAITGLPSVADERFTSRAEQLAHLRKSTAGAPIATAAADAREEQYCLQASEVLPLLRAMTPTPIGYARPAFVDRRPALRQAIEEARTEGIHASVIKDMERELDFEHVRAATAKPSGTIAWGGATPLAG